MSVRSCLLCGRALSRWSGNGDDFCSREHRNQYRLRRSMDRLQEANKVASVMRRRESPRPLNASRLINSGMHDPRGFMDPQMTPPPPAALPQIAAACSPGMAPTGKVVKIARAASVTTKRSLCSAPLPVRTSAPLIMPMRVGMADPSPRSAPPIRGIADRVPAAQTRRRPMATAWQCTTKPVPGKILPRIEPPRAYPVGEEARAGAFGTAASAAKGKALRVSLAAGFRIPEWKMRPVLFEGPSGAQMVWPGVRPLCSEPFAAGGEVALAGLSPTDLLSSPEMRIPMAPSPIFLTIFRWPEVKGLSVGSINPAVLHRSAFVPITTSDEYSASEEFSAKERTYEYRN